MERDLFGLKLATRWVGTWLEIYNEVDSTNLVAERLSAAGAPEGTLVIADRQSAGRGRLGRSFHSPAELGLYMSLLLRPGPHDSQLQQYIFLAALAVAESATEVLPDSVAVEIKWPNDVLLDGKKTSGINLPVQLGRERAEYLGRFLWRHPKQKRRGSRRGCQCNPLIVANLPGYAMCSDNGH